ncbi:LamG-like jellyroll fold domain-containing protein [Paeniglutamicibacter antarcticus]|uniref:Laminin G domain-containing protein n=1 Tax=Paeniglutamicibacter antarcticus TaxID=494023 RepID=A0ABP9TQ11_9MICC
MHKGISSALASLSATAMVMALLVLVSAPAYGDAHPSDPATPSTVTADALPTVQINGVVWSQVVIGNVVYAGGSFSTARPAGAPAGTQTVVRNNILAYDIATGELINSFSPSFNGQVLSLAASPDGSRLYAGGDFTTMNGESALRMVALEPDTGQRIADFDPQPSNSVRTMVATESTVYFGGSFFRVGSAWREQLAAVRASDATLLALRPVVTGGRVDTLSLSPDGSKLAVGGQFDTVNGTKGNSSALAVVRADTGEKMAYPASAYVRNGVGGDGSITSIASDDSTFYASGFTFGRQSTLEGIVAINWSDLDTRWLEDCHGDTYSVYATDDLVYLAGHPHYCGNIGGFAQESPWEYNRAMAFGKDAAGIITREIHGYTNFEGLPHPKLQTWFPALSAGRYTGQNQGPWNVAGNGDFVVYGGEFLRVNYQDQQGLVRFAASSQAPNLRGPEPQGDAFVPSLSSTTAGEVRVRWQAAHDQDDTKLAYKVIRDGKNSAPIHTVEADSTFWDRPGHSFTDAGLALGSTHTYRVFASDPSGRESRSQTVSITVATNDEPSSHYAQVIEGDKPANHWPIKASDEATLVDESGDDDLKLNGNAGIDPGSTLTGASGTSLRLNSGIAADAVRAHRPNEFATELWFKASSNQQGRLIGYGNAITGNSSNHDRLTYINSLGKLSFGVYERGARRTITSSDSYTDGKWHHVVSTLGANGMRLYVDGQEVASRASTTTALELDGFWRLGSDRMSGWPSAPSSGFSGLLDEVAIYDRQLSAASIANHYQAGQGQMVNVSPVAALMAEVDGMAVEVDGTGSSDPDGTVTHYAWDRRRVHCTRGSRNPRLPR